MNILDIILAAPLVVFIVLGWKRGLVREVATLAGVLLGIWAAVHLSQLVAELLGLEGESAVLIAFLVCFVGALVLTWLLGRLVEGLLKATKLSVVNHLAGALLGTLKALCILAVLLNSVVMLDHEQKLLKPELKEESMLYKPVYSTGNRLMESLKQFVTDHRDEWETAIKADIKDQNNS